MDTPHLKRSIAQAAGYIRDTWQQVVMGTLQVPGAVNPKVNLGLRQIYADNIVTSARIVAIGSITQRVLCLSQIAKDLEDGRGPFDMKPMLLKGPKSRISKAGKRYNIIPFRHGTAGTYSPNSNFKTMPQDIYKQARELRASVRNGNGIGWGGKLTGTEEKYKPGQNKSTGYQHKNGLYEGMVRIEKTYGKATQNKYMTFRVVSENSDPDSWWHPGYQAHHIAQGVSEFCRPAVEQMIQAAAEADLVKLLDLTVI